MADVLISLFFSGVLAFVAGLMGWMGSRGTLPRNAVFGIRTGSTTASDEAWFAAHKAAAPFSYGSAVLFTAGGIASATLGTMETSLQIFLVGGIALGVITLGFGVRAATKAAKAV